MTSGTENPETEKVFVVFYDCCLPKRQFGKVLPRVVQFADHIFVRDIFPEEICRSDYKVFSEVAKEWEAQYRGRICFLITWDRNFIKQVQRHPLYEKGVFILRIEPSNSSRMNWQSARLVASLLCDRYIDLIEKSK